MKKIQNYLTRPEELRKKLENPAFRHDFMQWSKSHLCQPQNGRQRTHSKSPHERSRSQLGQQNLKNNHSNSFNVQLNQSHNQSANSQSRSKQNIAPNYLYNGKPNNSLPKKNAKYPVSESKQPKVENSKVKPRKPLPSQSKSHSFLHVYRSNEEAQSSRMNYSSLKKTNHNESNKPEKVSSRQHSASNSNLLKNKKKNEKISLKDASNNQVEIKKIEFKYSYRTRQGVLVTNPNKTNQDRLLIKTNVNNSNKNIFAVADGHGAHGHFVSQCIVSNMSAMLDKEFMNKDPLVKKDNNSEPEFVLPSIYNRIQKILSETTQINAQCSGSTLVTVSLEDEYITCANVGDSRAILARQVDKKSWEVIYLSQDQKPCVESEKKRILKYGGRIHALQDEKGQQVGPLRVWLPNQNIQGLAMSRSLGDNVSKPYGVTHRPEIVKIPTDKRDKFILIASDGVWQFITNQEVLQLIVPFYRQKKLEEACDALLKLAYDRWTVEDTSVVDDITFILIFLQG